MYGEWLNHLQNTENYVYHVLYKTIPVILDQPEKPKDWFH